MDPIKRLLEIATHEVGTHEDGGNNCGPRIVEYQSATWLKPAPWPWCAAFICWILREWLKSPEVLAKLSLRNNDNAEGVFFHRKTTNTIEAAWIKALLATWPEIRSCIQGQIPAIKS